MPASQRAGCCKVSATWSRLSIPELKVWIQDAPECHTFEHWHDATHGKFYPNLLWWSQSSAASKGLYRITFRLRVQGIYETNEFLHLVPSLIPNIFHYIYEQTLNLKHFCNQAFWIGDTQPVYAHYLPCRGRQRYLTHFSNFGLWEMVFLLVCLGVYGYHITECVSVFLQWKLLLACRIQYII
jgi:hypothetical protein